MKKIPLKIAKERILKTYDRRFWYWLGCIGQKGTESLWRDNSNRELVAKWYAQHPAAKQKGLDAAGVIDCCGENKYLRWVQPDGSVIYNYDGQGDLNETMIKELSAKLKLRHGTIDTLPENNDMLILGYQGHMSYSLGNGKVLEARGGAYGVQINDYKSRGFTDWYEDPFIEYGYVAREEETNMLYKGCPDSEAVKEWQESLMLVGVKMINSKGVVCTADSNFGEGTENGTNLFKKSVGLAENGKVDDVTYGRMLNKIQSMYTSSTTMIKDYANTISSKNKEIESVRLALNTEISNLKKESANKLAQIDMLKTAATTLKTRAETAEARTFSVEKQINNLVDTYNELLAANSKLLEEHSKCSTTNVQLMSNATVGELIKAIFKKLKPRVDDVLNTK